MEEQYRKEITWWFAELGSESEVDNYLALFPGLIADWQNLLSAY